MTLETALFYARSRYLAGSLSAIGLGSDLSRGDFVYIKLWKRRELEERLVLNIWNIRRGLLS